MTKSQTLQDLKAISKTGLAEVIETLKALYSYAEDAGEDTSAIQSSLDLAQQALAALRRRKS